MDVFVVPISQESYDLYCEVPIEHVITASDATQSTWWRRQTDRFRQVLAKAEEDHHRRERGQASESRGLWRWMMRKVAEAIVEQRVLWSLRRQTTARLVHADDISSDRALEIARGLLRSDFEKHRRWLVIDGLLTLLCLPLTIIPGPNVPSLYFTFRAVGHYFSFRGASHGLNDVGWQIRGSAELTALRQALALDPDGRNARVQQIGAALGLHRLDAFVRNSMEH